MPQGMLKSAGFLFIMKYTKPPLSISDQIKLVKSRGLIISDHHKAERHLSNISYYRLSAYMYPFKNLETNEFINKITLDEIIDLYFFDKELRLLVFDAVETIEVSFRSQLIYYPSIKKGAFWFEDKSNFRNENRWLKHIKELDEKVYHSDETFIKHFLNKYDDETPPAWMTFEVLSFGLLSKFYQNLKDSLNFKKEISRHFGVSQPIVFQSWMRSINYVRNICAHHSRLWNKVLTNKSLIPHNPPAVWISEKKPDNSKIYYFLCCLVYLLKQVKPDTDFVQKIESLFAKYPQVSKEAMGFPENWKNEKLWQ